MMALIWLFVFLITLYLGFSLTMLAGINIFRPKEGIRRLEELKVTKRHYVTLTLVFLLFVKLSMVTYPF